MKTGMLTRSPAADSSRSFEWIAPSRRTQPFGAPDRAHDHSFGRIGLTDIATANPTGEETGDEVLTQSDAGPDAGSDAGRDAGPDAGPEAGPDAGPDAGTTPANNCSVRSGPSYTPSGTIPVTTAGGRKRATFDLAAAFDTDTATGKKPSCCEVRQFIKWDRAFHTWRGGPPHSGFPSSAAADTWIEDRGAAGFRYGHRTNPGVAGCGDQYKAGATQDMANGDSYCGRDTPSGPTTMTGKFQFRLDVIEACAGGTTKTSSPVITVNW